jgi:hypothetical protein
MTCTVEQFLQNVRQHTMTVLREDGVYRHIRFQQPGTSCYHFDLITWPGHLCYTGDMGTYVFQRLTDMFAFFRTDQEAAQRRGKSLGINLSYWSEKLVAVDGNRRHGSAKAYSHDRFQQIVKEQLVTWWRDYGLDRHERRALREAIEGVVLSADENDVRAFDAANDFSCTIGTHTFAFHDFWDHDLTDYTHSFIWCCYALAWGIAQYDAAQATPTP